jgi:hypothetical protein
MGPITTGNITAGKSVWTSWNLCTGTVRDLESHCPYPVPLNTETVTICRQESYLNQAV